MNKKVNTKKNKVNLPQMLTSVFLTLMLTFYLLYTGSGDYRSITQAKFSAFCWITGGYILLMLLLGLEMLIIGQVKFPSVKSLVKNFSWTQRFVFLFLIFTALSAMLSPFGKETILGMTRYEGLLTISMYCVCFLLVSVFGRPDGWQVYLFGGAMTVFCVLSLAQLNGYNPFSLYPAGYNYYDANIAYSGAYLGTIGNVDLVAALLCVAFPLFWVSVIRMSGKLKYLLLIPMVLCLAVLIISNVQAGLVGAVGGAVIILPAVLPVSKRAKRILWIVLLSIIVLGAAFIWAYDFGGDGTLYEAHELLHGRWNDDYGSGRIYIWRNVLEQVPDRLLFGGGPDTLSARMSAYFERYDVSSGQTIRANIDTAHNDYLNILVNQGLFAFLCFMGALISSALQFIRNKSNPSAIICGSAVLCYCIQAFFGISMCIAAPFFWLAWAMLEKSNNRKQ